MYTSLKDELTKFLISSTFFIGVITICGNLIPFLFFLGYFSYYRIPMHFIELDVRDILIGAFVVIVLLYLTVPTFAYVKQLKAKVKNTRSGLLLFVSFIYSVIFYILLGFYFITHNTNILIIMFVCAIAILGCPFVIYRTESQGRAWYQNIFNKNNMHSVEASFGILFNLIKNPIILGIILASAFAFTCVLTGYFYASIKGNYYIVKGDNTWLIVMIYKDAYIEEQYDPIKHALINNLRLVTTIDGLQIEKIRTGTVSRFN